MHCQTRLTTCCRAFAANSAQTWVRLQGTKARSLLSKAISMRKFNYEVDFKATDFREHPELYQVGRGEQGVLLVEPYKSELLPHWKFKDPDCATASSEKLYNMYQDYKNSDDFVGMDMARKYLQVGIMH